MIKVIIFNLSFSIDSSSTFLTADLSGGTQPYAYNWSTGATTNTISVMSGETYRVEGEDSNGCVIIEDYTVQ